MVIWLCGCNTPLQQQPDFMDVRDGTTHYFHVFVCPACHRKTKYHFFTCTVQQGIAVCGTELERFDQMDTPRSLAYRCPICQSVVHVNYTTWTIIPNQEENIVYERKAEKTTPRKRRV